MFGKKAMWAMITASFIRGCDMFVAMFAGERIIDSSKVFRSLHTVLPDKFDVKNDRLQ